MSFWDFLFGRSKKEDFHAEEEERNIKRTAIPTIRRPQEKDYSDLLEDVRSTFGKLYVRATENYVHFKHCSAEVPTGVYFGKTKYTGQSNRNGKREVAFLLSDGTIAGILDRKEWNNHEKAFTTDNLNWIGYSVGGKMEVTVAEKFKEDFVKYQLRHTYPSWIADEELREAIRREVEKQHLSEGEFHNNKAHRKSYYEDGEYDLCYNNKYMIAGCYLYVTSPFVAIGYAENEETNKVNSQAMVVKTLDSVKVGYVSEKELRKFRAETGGRRTPLVLEAHYYKGQLYGWLYTYTDNAEEYTYMENQYHELLREVFGEGH